MPLGAFLPTRAFSKDPRAIRDWAMAVEELGYDYIDVPDHVLGVDRQSRPDFEGPYDISDAFHETFVTLGYLAAITERVRLRSAVLILPQRQTALVAKQAAEVDVLSGGRFDLGVGVGWNSVEYEALNEDWKTRGSHQTEQLEAMQRLWTNDVVNYNGKFHNFNGIGLNPRPIQQPIPIWFGGSADATLRRAVRYGAGWIPLGKPDVDAVSRLTALCGYLEAAGRDPDGFGIECWIRTTRRDPDSWARAANAWRDIGATDVTLYTSGTDIETVADQIDALRAFKERSENY
ncbi:MAG: TIGR03619 family F420-dependent LLM class oxidoreductase [Alphaproteobacteria bacterium]|nr:TIGR03619 family F420-dependent LLM class oxidoreductase [Alphaproteobacteria bacterium]